MTDEHKAALKQGREDAAAVRGYLEALATHKPKRGRKRTEDSIKKRLATIEERLTGSDALSRVNLLQERRDLHVELATMGASIDLSTVEEAFVKSAAAYGQRKAIAYATWREAGVDAAVLKRAGIRRGGVGG